MQGINDNDDADQSARRQAALAAQARARQTAAAIAADHAADVYDQARRNAVGYVPALPGYVPPPPGHPMPPLPRRQVIPGVPVAGPPPPAFAVGAMTALADVSTAMTAIVDTLTRRSGNYSRAHDGEVVINKTHGAPPNGRWKKEESAGLFATLAHSSCSRSGALSSTKGGASAATSRAPTATVPMPE